MKRILGTSLMVMAIALVAAPKAEAAVILTFGQAVQGNTIVGTATGGVTTQIVGTNVSINVTQIENVVGSLPAFFNLTANSTSAAALVDVFGNIVAGQRFTGTFCITSLINCGGVNYLSGTFLDVTAGQNGGASLVMSATTPAPTDVIFTSSVISSLDLQRAVSLSFSNVTPLVSISGATLASFASSVSGTFSASVGQVPEPGSMLLLGTGLLGLAAAARRRAARKS